MNNLEPATAHAARRNLNRSQKNQAATAGPGQATENQHRTNLNWCWGWGESLGSAYSWKNSNFRQHSLLNLRSHELTKVSIIPLLIKTKSNYLFLVTTFFETADWRRSETYATATQIEQVLSTHKFPETDLCSRRQTVVPQASDLLLPLCCCT